MSVPPSGAQHEISSGEHRATIVEVGGGVRSYAVGGRDVLNPYPVDAMCDGAHGAPLIPWPNRLADGHYSFEGNDYQVALNEPEKNNAIHGFLRWRSWQAVEHGDDRVVMATHLRPMQGYPFNLDVQVEYTVSEDGLIVRATARNVGDQAAPYAFGQHPYLSPGGGLIDECTLELKAATWVDTDNERQLPTGNKPTAGSHLDFNTARAIGDQKMDFPFTDLERDADGKAWMRLTAPDGSCASLWADETCEFLEVYTGDTLKPARRRTGLGAEPMTAPPNAFQRGYSLLHLARGATPTTRWGARLD
jgi:aldose 1-epimerase